jgi:hypothetical protein
MDFLLSSAAPEKSPLRREERQGGNSPVEKALRGEKSSVERLFEERRARWRELPRREELRRAVF